jgi:hypothetical protein
VIKRSVVVVVDVILEARCMVVGCGRRRRSARENLAATERFSGAAARG